ncbi:MAG: hypothetical protein OEZ41_06420 [Nitrospirota bacterium]|nr:hypothetical protein [Nitrospirota bacterium]MDH5699581.1 hypothetical protein [Nitrospirota bacterium]
MVARLLAAKKASRKPYDQLAKALRLCHAPVAQVFRLQVRLKPKMEAKLVTL